MEWEMTLRNEREKGREEGREEERAKTEEQRKRAEAEKERAEAEKERAEAEKSGLILRKKGFGDWKSSLRCFKKAENDQRLETGRNIRQE